MSQRTIAASSYIGILIALLALTVLTVALSFQDLPAGWHVGAGMMVAVVKASLVVLFFMHAVLSARVTWTVIVVAIVWIGILFSLTLCDYLTRSMIPYVPGH